MSGEPNRVVILENGLWEMKLGFSGDEAPRYLQQSIVGYPKNSAVTVSSGNKEIFIGKEAAEHEHILDIHSSLKSEAECNWEVLEKLLHNMLYGSLKIELENFPCFLILNHFFDKQKKLKLVELIFENYDFPSLYLQSSNVTGLYYDGRTTGMVVDSGFSQTNCISVFEGYPIEEKIFKSNFGGRHLNGFFKNILNESIESQRNRFSVKSDFFNHYGYNFHDLYYENLRMSLVSQGYSSKAVILPDGNEVVIDSQEFRKYQNYFVESVGSQIHDCFLVSEEKYKAEFASSISLIGGNCISVGLENSIEEYLLAKGMKQFSISQKTDDEKRFASWIGASMFASMDSFQNLLIKRSEYAENGAEAIIKKNLI
jgi:actin-related protein